MIPWAKRVWCLEKEQFGSKGNAEAVPTAGGAVVGQRTQRMRHVRAKI